MSKTEIKSDVEVVSDEKQETKESQWYYFYYFKNSCVYSI